MFKENFIWKDDIPLTAKLMMFYAEMNATFLFVTVACFATVQKVWETFEIPLLQLAFAFGFAVMIGVQFGAQISGGHINPVVTLTACILGKKAWMDFPIYFLAQCSGSILAYLLIWAITEKVYIKTGNLYACAPFIHTELYIWQGLIVEILASFILALTCCGIWDSRNRTHLDAISLKFAFVVIAELLAFGHFTGCHMNPARSIGPAVFSLDFSSIAIYIVGPLVGGAAAAVLYRAVWALPYEDEMQPWRQ